MTDYKDKLYEKIAELVSYVCNNPAIYFSETDIHVLMMKALMEIGCLKRRYNTKCTIGRNYKGKASEYKYKTMLVHKEYGCNTGKRERSDIVIFDEQGVNSIDDPINLKNGKKYLTPEYVFEFGTEKSASAIKNYEKHLKGDLKKLSKIENKGFLIHIQRTNVKASTETERFKKNRKRIQDYVNSTVKIWGNERKKLKDKVEVLIFFVDIGGERRTVREKVRMFNPYPKNNKAADWIKVNLKVIEKITMNFLKKDISDLAIIIKSVKQK